jgi:hypothetical protein
MRVPLPTYWSHSLEEMQGYSFVSSEPSVRSKDDDEKGGGGGRKRPQHTPAFGNPSLDGILGGGRQIGLGGREAALICGDDFVPA